MPRAPRLICRCLGVSSPRIVAAVREHGLRGVEEVTRLTRAGSACTTCRPEIRELLDELAGAPVPAAQRDANRRQCRAETARRVEAVLFGGACSGPGLAPDAIELVAVDGLQVDLHLHAGDSPEQRARIVDALHKGVCADLVVSFG